MKTRPISKTAKKEMALKEAKKIELKEIKKFFIFF